MTTKICPICGRKFEAGGSVKYCSSTCRDEGAKQARKAWEKRSGYGEKRRVMMRAYRARKAAQREPEAQKRREARAKAYEDAVVTQRQKLQERAAAGDPFARMRLSNHFEVEYWQAFQEYELSFARDSKRTVNGISAQDPDFPGNVVDSIYRIGTVMIQ